MNIEKDLNTEPLELGLEKAGDVSLKRVEGKDVYVEIKGSVYLFSDVPDKVLESFKGMLAKGAGFNALRFIQDKVGKGTKVNESTINSITDEILSGKEITDEILTNDEDVKEVFGASKIICDADTCISNTKGKCQKSSLTMTNRFCSNYQARGI